MQRSTETPEQIPPDAKFYSVPEFSPIVRNDLYYLTTRFNPITIAGYDSTTNSDSNGCTFEENLRKCLKPPTYIKFVDPKNRLGNILLENLKNFDFIEAIDLSECGFTEIPSVLLYMKQLKVLNISGNHIHSLPDDWGHLDLSALDISHNVLSEANSSIKCQKNLEVLVMENCNLKYFPCHVLELRKLRCLVLDDNPLGKLDLDAVQSNSLQLISLKSCLIPEFCGSWLPHVHHINVGNNSIQDFPADLNRDITVLKLYGNQLDTIPDDLSLLENLNELDVSFCELKEFPSPILELKKLEHLNISNNFIRSIPQDITRLQLKMFHLGKNPLDKFPKFLYQFSALEKTDLSNCYLERIPPVIFGLKNLTTINLRDNCITEIPEEVCQLNLEKLNVADNPLNELPESFRNFVNMEDLDISFTNLEEIPFQILYLNNIKRLAVKNNVLEKLPESWEKCINIQCLDLSENPFCTLPASISQLQKLEKLNFKSCCLSEFPNALLHLATLQILNLEDNFITELPGNFHSLNVKSLNIRRNMLIHSPDSLSSQSKLQNIDVSSNRLTEFPSVIFKLHNIKHIGLGDNFITVLPETWEGLHIVTLSLDRNPLVKIGNSPLNELKYIVSLSLRNCLLDEIPAYFSFFSRMSKLDISHNNIMANAIVALPPNLTRLVLDNNPLGSVPESVQEVVKLSQLSLNSCNLRNLPAFICLLKQLQYLSICSNSLTSLPAGVCNTMLATINLSWNPLGCLDSLNSAKRLRLLIAYGCRLHDFPRETLNLKKLTELYSGWNSFNSLPGDLRHNNLRTLSFYCNPIRTVPKAIINLKNLRTLVVDGIQEFPDAVLNMPQLSSLNIQVDFDSLLMLPNLWKELGNLQNLSCTSVLNLISIGSLVRLENLAIQSTKEAIPVDAIRGNFLKKLTISSSSLNRENRLPSIQSDVLQTLDIRHYKLPYIPSALVGLSRLRKLCISRSHVKDFPQELCENLKKLEILDISENSLRTLPKVWRCRRLRELNLIQAPSDSLPVVLQQLPCLTRLNVSDCRLFLFPPAFLQLKKLTDLNISNNHITDLPTEWNNVCLKHLKIADNELGQGSSLSVIAKLSSLETLDVSGNALNQFPSFVQCLKFLHKLNISNNPVRECPENMGNFQTLEIFKGSACELKEFPRFLLHLQKIRDIELERNKIKIIPEDYSLPFLKTLRLGNNKGLNISSDTLLGAESLERLDLQSCGLTEIPKLVLKIPVLHILHLEGNVITRIPEATRAIKMIPNVRINTNILIEPPKEIYEGSEETVNQYYADLKISEACNVGFRNIILLGSATAGKTSLIKSLINNESTLTKLEDRTIAVDEEILEVVENLHFHVIDFGGHEVYELVYPIFLKDRKASIIIAVDLSVISDSTQEANLFPWLYTALSITGDSSDIVVVGTKADLCEDEEAQLNYLRISIQEWVRQMLRHAKKLLDTEELQQEQRNQIKHFKQMAVREIRTLTTSSQSMSGFKELTNILLNHGRDNFAHLPGNWNELYKSLSGLKDQINYEGFYKVAQLSRLCKEPLDADRIQAYLTFMHQRGIVLWYGNHNHLKDYVFYDIGFIITILNQLLRHNMESTFQRELHRPFFQTMKEQEIAVESFRETGLASQKLLKCLWKNIADTEELYRLAISVLQLFSICYEANSNFRGKAVIKDETVVQTKQQILLFPWFVRSPIDVSALEKLWPEQIPQNHIPLKCNFVFEYSIPKSLFEQFSVQLQNLLAKCHRRKDWKGTIYIKQGAVQLLVRQTGDKVNDRASIVVEMRSVLENTSQMYKLFVSVAKTIQVLRTTFPGILYNEEYVCPHCILTNADAKHTLPLDEALHEYPGETRQSDCKQDEIPAALHYPKLLGKSCNFNEMTFAPIIMTLK